MSEKIIEELRESYEKYGPMRSVIRTQFGICSGNTRHKAVAEWPEKKMSVDNYYEHLKMAVADNIHETKNNDWWASVLNEAAVELKRMGVEKGKIIERLNEDFPLSKSTIYKYIGEEFKEEGKVKAGKASGKAREVSVPSKVTDILADEPEKKEVKWPRGTAPRMSDYRQSSYTKAHVVLMGVLTRMKLPFKSEQAFQREGCLLYTSPSPRDRQRSRMPSSA